MTLANMPDEVFTLNTFKASLPQAVNHGVSAQFPDTVCITEVCRNTLACNLSTTRLKVILTGPLTRHCRQAEVGMSFGKFRGFGASIMVFRRGTGVVLRLHQPVKYTIIHQKVS
jgi:hypothetical protein